MARINEVDLRVELSKSSYAVGELVEGSVQVHTTCPVTFESATLVWQSISTVRGEERPIETVMQSISQPLSELTGRTVEGTVSLPVGWRVPQETPTTADLDVLDGVIVTTDLTATLVLGKPFNDTITRHYPIKIIAPPMRTGGILQGVEFAPRCCFCFSLGKAYAQVELAKTHYTAGDRVKATVIVDLAEFARDLRGISIGLRRTIASRDGRVDLVEEHDLFEGPRSGPIAAGNKTALTVETWIPGMAFAPDVDSNTVKIKHTALILFYCPYGWEVETEVPIFLVHPEAIN